MPLFVGLDLGTTNSAAAVFDGEAVKLVRPKHGGDLTPSVVRIAKSGKIIVGSRAVKYLTGDPGNTAAGFKRLMGTEQMVAFPASNREMSPQELSTLILKSLLDDVENQYGTRPSAAVVTVPALFDVPQSAATAQAARDAGLSHVELLQEPVASAIAAGWTEEQTGAWLVYDMGGGTFDVTLVEPDDTGTLRVLAHDGDNFLGGRDIDLALVNWVLEQLDGVQVDRADAVQELRPLCEEAKIELSSERTTTLLFDDISFLSASAPEELELSRDQLDDLVKPFVRRTIEITQRLLADNGRDKDDITRTVLVGGPTVMPLVRSLVGSEIAPVTAGLDPMALVASGAALFAAAEGIAANAPGEKAPEADTVTITLDYPSISASRTATAVGRVVKAPSDAVEISCTDQHGRTFQAAVDDEGVFVLALSLDAGKMSSYTLKAHMQDRVCRTSPETFTIVQGMTISAPPLSRSIGVALATGGVREYFSRGTPLPMRRTFVHKTVDPLGLDGTSQLLIPIVQGEYEQASLCQAIGSIVLETKGIDKHLPAGTEVQLTLSIDRGGRLSGSAFVPSLAKHFDKVMHLLVPEASAETLLGVIDQLRSRVSAVRRRAMSEGNMATLDALTPLESPLFTAQTHLADSPQPDSLLQIANRLREVDAELVELETAGQWQDVADDAETTLGWAGYYMHRFGTKEESRRYDSTAKKLYQALESRSIAQVKRLNKQLLRLGIAAKRRDPEYWYEHFESASARLSEMSDLVLATKLVDQGRQAALSRKEDKVKAIVEQLWQLLPPDYEERHAAFDSGVR